MISPESNLVDSSLYVGESKTKILAYFLGKCLEAFDFTIYGLLISRVAELFFPPDILYAPILCWLLFSVSYFVRPFGGVVFGYLGDFVSQNTAVSIGLYAMGFSSLIIGFLPTYNQIGIFAPFILLCCRIIQGLAMASEFPGSTAIMISHYKLYNGLVASLISAAGTLGILLGSFSIWVSDLLVSKSLSWRIPFIIGSLSLLAGIYVQQAFSNIKINKKESSSDFFILIKNLYNLYFTQIIQTILLSALVGINFNIGFLWWNSYATSLHFVASSYIRFILNIGLILVIFISPLTGFLSDIYGIRKTLIIGIFINTVCLPIALYLTSKGIFWISPLFIACSCAAFAPIALLYALKIFPVNIRYTGVSIGWNIGAAFIGSTSPIISQTFINLSQRLGILLVCIYIILVSLLTILLIARSPTYNYE